MACFQGGYVYLWHQPVQTHKVGDRQARTDWSDPWYCLLSVHQNLFLAAAAPVKIPKVKACLCLHSTVSTPWDCSTCLTVHSLADLFIPTPFVLIWESDFVVSWLYLVSSVSWRATPELSCSWKQKEELWLDVGCRKSLKLTSVRGKEMTFYSLSWWWH